MYLICMYVRIITIFCVNVSIVCVLKVSVKNVIHNKNVYALNNKLQFVGLIIEPFKVELRYDYESR